MAEFSGGCLCGAIRYAGSNPQGGGHCYCKSCRRSSGSSHCTHMIVSEDSIAVQGDLTFFDEAADSGNNVSRGFCPNCGSAVLSKNSGMPRMSFVRASSLDDPNVFNPEMNVYVSRAPKWSEPDTDLPSFPGMPSPQDMPESVQ
jgi:hypothetical protein